MSALRVLRVLCVCEKPDQWQPCLFFKSLPSPHPRVPLVLTCLLHTSMRSSWQPTFEFSQSLTDGGQDPTPGPTPTSRPPPPAGSCEDKYNPAINCGALNQEICK